MWVAIESGFLGWVVHHKGENIFAVIKKQVLQHKTLQIGWLVPGEFSRIMVRHLLQKRPGGV